LALRQTAPAERTRSFGADRLGIDPSWDAVTQLYLTALVLCGGDARPGRFSGRQSIVRLYVAWPYDGFDFAAQVAVDHGFVPGNVFGKDCLAAPGLGLVFLPELVMGQG